MPLHFIWGDEDYLIDKVVSKIVKETLNDDINELNYRLVDNPSFALFSEVLRTNASMFGKILIKIKCPNYFLEQKDKEKIDDKQTLELIEDFKNVSDMVTIILLCPTPKGEKKKPDSRKKIYKELVKVANVQEFQTYRTYEEDKIIPHVKKMAEELKIKISDSNISFLIQITGSYLRDIYTQLEKLKLFSYPKGVIEEDMIKEIASTNFNILQVCDLLLEKKNTEALKIISELLQKEHYLPILAYLQTVISSYTKIKILSNKFSNYEIAEKTGQKPFLIEKNLKKMKKISLNELIQLRINLVELDYKMKIGVYSDVMLAFEMAFMGGDLCLT